ncbi:MAG: class IV adenylate cyclase [Ignavibacteriales bacterium]|nr:class IV adenylate cyclase [Ignavibacteriales bacterium]
MNRNLELKAAVRSLRSAASIAESLPARRAGILIQTDTYFKVSSGRLKLRETQGANSELIFYARPNRRGARLSRYLRFRISNPKELSEALSQIFEKTSVIRKKRILYLHRNARIHLDLVQGLGTFVEFEVIVRRGLSQAKALMNALKKAFGIRTKDLRAGSYGDLKRTKRQ